MSNNYYFVMPKNHPDYDWIILAAATKHGRHTPDETVLSVTQGIDDVLVKVAGGTPEWFETLPKRNLLDYIGRQGDSDADEARLFWLEAQDPDFDSNNDNQPDTQEQRRSWWRTLLGM